MTQNTWGGMTAAVLVAPSALEQMNGDVGGEGVSDPEGRAMQACGNDRGFVTLGLAFMWVLSV